MRVTGGSTRVWIRMNEEAFMLACVFFSSIACGAATYPDCGESVWWAMEDIETLRHENTVFACTLHRSQHRGLLVRYANTPTLSGG